MPDPSAFEIEMAVEKTKRHQLTGIDQISAELIKAGGKTICSEICKLINYIWNEEELPVEWKESIMYLLLIKVIKQNVAVIEAYQFCQVHKVK